jgi:hypothetical protein
MRVYRVWRDDAYLRDMMLLLQELQVRLVTRPFQKSARQPTIMPSLNNKVISDVSIAMCVKWFPGVILAVHSCHWLVVGSCALFGEVCSPSCFCDRRNKLAGVD